MRKLGLFVLLAHAAFAQQDFPLRAAQQAEFVADVDCSSRGADWAIPGREAALADVSLDGAVQQHIMLYAGAVRHTYSVFLGRIEAGAHPLRVTRNEKYSAAGAALTVHGVRFREINSADPHYAAIAHAPVLYARANTLGKFSDVPMVVYCERLQAEGKQVLQYTVIFSNEDGGTNSRALMARWGRTTDIEYIYRGVLDGKGGISSAIIQTRNHENVEFDGKYFGGHPILIPITDNNMVGSNQTSAIRYQITPIEVDLTHKTRESVMDTQPVTWRVMAKELQRESKLRPFGVVEGAKISDPRNYLYLDVRSTLKDGIVDFLVRLKGETEWRTSSTGRPDYAIARDGWVRSTIELPPGTTREQIAEFGFSCLTPLVAKDKPQPAAGVCQVREVGPVFLLGADQLPGPQIPLQANFTIPSGIIKTVPVR